MQVNEFLSKVIDDDYELHNMAFDEDKDEFINLVSNFKSKIAIGVSSSFFDENINLMSNIKDIKCLEFIISLPIFCESKNLILILLNYSKNSDNFILIDESDNLIHKNTSLDNDLANKIYNSIKNYELLDTALSVSVNNLISNEDAIENNSAKKSKKDYDDFLALKPTNNSLDKKAVKNRVISNDIADSILEIKEKKSIREEIKRHSIRSVDETTSYNFHSNFLNESFHDRKRQNMENLLYKGNKRLIDGDVEFKRLGKIADLHNIDEKNQKDTILVATCKSCTSKLVYYNNDVNDFKNEVYVEINNIDDNISKEYLYEYLNSANGMDEILYFSKGFNYIRADNIQSVIVPIPPLNIQNEIVKASRESREFFKTVDLLKNEYNSNIFDYKHIVETVRELKGDFEFDSKTSEITKLSRSWRHAYQGLIWPLAISYLSATKGGFEIVEKKENYLTLFEFIAAFNCIILLSGLPEDLYQSNFGRIWNSRNSYEYNSMTFANWVYASKNIADVYRKNNFTSKLDEELFNKISSNKMLKILEEAKNLRNVNAHGSQTNAYEAKEIIEKLDNYLDDVFDILEVYSKYKLIYVTGDYKSANGSINHRIILLNGPCAQPIYDNIILDSPLMGNSLYLYNPKNNKKLLIKDSLMKFKPIDENKKRWALFIYSHCDRNEFNAFYKCFQSNEELIKESIDSSLKEDILGLSYEKSFNTF